MSQLTAASKIRNTPARSFVHASQLPGTPTAARQAASRAARSGDLIQIRRGLYYRGVNTRFGMTKPTVEEIAKEVLGTKGIGPAGYSAAREWGVSTQIPACFQVATLWTADPIAGITQHARRNKERLSLNFKEIALIELMRAPEVFVEAGWGVLVSKVRDSLALGEIVEKRLRVGVAGERGVAVRANFERLLSDLASL